MYIGKTLRAGAPVGIIVGHATEERLQTKCFRGTSLACAGNFQNWNSASQMFRDDEVMNFFLAELDELWIKGEFGVQSVNILLSKTIGWESTAPLSNYADADLEHLDLSRRSWGLRVKLSRRDLLTPKTNELTIVFQLKSEDDRAVVIVRSMYPGFDVGELDGDVTDREKRVFFDWNHPGEV